MVIDKTKIKTELLNFLLTLLKILFIVFVIRTFIMTPYEVSGKSMYPTLKDGERLFVAKYQYLISKPKRGDIVIFHSGHDSDYVKRVIGIAGDTVQYKNDVLYLNGKPTPEPYLEPYKKEANSQGLLFTEDFGPIKVSENEIFVLGDNRLDSLDSRSFGPIKLYTVQGKVAFVYYPLPEIRTLN